MNSLNTERKTFCETCAKTIFEDIDEAQSVLEKIARQEDAITLEIYRCPVGEGWHLHSKK